MCPVYADESGLDLWEEFPEGKILTQSVCKVPTRQDDVLRCLGVPHARLAIEWFVQVLCTQPCMILPAVPDAGLNQQNAKSLLHCMVAMP